MFQAPDSIYAEIARAVPVVIGGLLATGGGVIAQFVTHYLTVRREKASLRRERLEAFVKAIYAQEQWIADSFNKLFSGEENTAPRPLNEARMLQSLHFPELNDELRALLKAQIPLVKFIGEQRVARLQGLDGFTKNWNPKPYDEAYGEFLAKMNAAVHKCRKLNK